MLYICATPIGNLEDITFRVARILGEVDMIAAEDTRHTVKLLNHLGIKKPLISFHEFSDESKINLVISKLSGGQDIALVSDAGMPCISDPGHLLVKACIENDIDFTVLPGASAFTTALVLSGLNPNKFMFCGFLPRKRADINKCLDEIAAERTTLIFYESPHRLNKTLEILLDRLGDRSIAVARELTKKFEQILRLKTSQAIDYYKQNEPRGEFVLIVEGAQDPQAELLDYDKEMQKYLEQGVTKKEAIKLISDRAGVPKRDVYSYFVVDKV